MRDIFVDMKTSIPCKLYGYILICVILALGHTPQVVAQLFETESPSLNPIYYLLFDDRNTTPLDGSELFQQLTVFEANSCLLKFNGEVVCWGRNDAGQLGNFTTYNPIAPVDVLDINTAVKIVSKQAILENGQVWAWGKRHFDDPIDLDLVTSPTALSDISDVLDISKQQHRHQCAVINGGEVKCWGDNTFGQLGNGTVVSSDTPVVVSGINSATSVTTGYLHSCAVLIDGTIKCWGYNALGQLGEGSTTRQTEPANVNGIDDAISISSGLNFNCAALTAGQVKCWGQNVFGQLGNGTNINALSPVLVQQLPNTKTVELGNHHACALSMDGLVNCWGKNSVGQLGNGTKMQSSLPVSENGISGVTALGSGEEHNCAVVNHNSVKCWGLNSAGQLGNRSIEDSTTPVTVDFSPVSVNNLAAEITESVDQEIEFKDASTAGKFYSLLDHDNNIYTRNPNVWTDSLTQNATCISVYSTPIQPFGTDSFKGATLITPQHILTSTSFLPIAVGDIVRFVDMTDMVHERTVTYIRHVPDAGGSFSKIRLARLSNPITPQVSTCKLAPADLEQYLKPHYALPTLSSGLEKYASLSSFSSINDNDFQFAGSNTLKRLEFTTGERNDGDGIFFIVNDELMLFSLFDNVPNVGLHLADINRLIGVIDSNAGDITGFQAQAVDLSSFDHL